MDNCLIVVAQNRPDLFQALATQHSGPGMEVILDRRGNAGALPTGKERRNPRSASLSPDPFLVIPRF